MRGVVRKTRWFALVLLACALTAVVIVFQMPPQRIAEAQENVPAPPARIQAEPAHPRYTGSGGCAARACHGSPTLTPGKEWNSAFTVWTTSDPHAQAYAVLFTPESRRMAAALGLGDAVKADRCLACHAMPVSGAHANQAAVDPSSLLTDGVGCEACHGPAENYLTAHTMRGWNELGDARFGPKFAMRNTAEPAIRAQVCAGCHVGQPDADGRPWRDVNHDLIAAGHPRLNFEFTAYMANLPPHWNVKKDPQRFEEARSWILGQFAVSDAALRLLESRAQNATAADTKTNAMTSAAIVPPAWPEFAEYNCFACHHGLNSAIRRSDLSPEALSRAHSGLDIDRNARPIRKPGAPAWGTWYFEGPRVIANAKDLLPADNASGFLNSLNAIATAMQTQMPNAPTVARDSSETRGLWANSQSLAQARFPRDAASPQAAALRRTIVESVQSQFENRQPECWDEYVQCYLALVAIHRSQRDALKSADPNANERFKQTAAILEAIRDRLKFPDDESSEDQQKSSPNLRVLRPGANSPDRFNPNSKRAKNESVGMAGQSLLELYSAAIELLLATDSQGMNR
jgi:hypothetical protein